MKPLIHLAALVMRHLREAGPCTFPEIQAYVREQYVGAHDYELSYVLTRLIREGLVELYDTGAFDAAPLSLALGLLWAAEDAQAPPTPPHPFS